MSPPPSQEPIPDLDLITSLSPIYTVFFLYIEPLSTIIGAVYAYFLPSTYLSLTHPHSAPSHAVPTGTQVALAQLANLYFLFALNEGLVLRSTKDISVWRTLLFGLLVADLGHLAACAALGSSKYWDVTGWNEMDWGNIAFVYVGAIMRCCFLTGIGVTTSPSRSTAQCKKS